MLSELEKILQEVKGVEKRVQNNVFRQGEIEEEIEDSSDFLELIYEIYQVIESLQKTKTDAKSRMLYLLIELDGVLSSCSNRIEMVQSLVQKLRNIYFEKKNL